MLCMVTFNLTLVNMPLADCSVPFLHMYRPCVKFLFGTPCPYHPIVLLLNISRIGQRGGGGGGCELSVSYITGLCFRICQYSHWTSCSLPFLENKVDGETFIKLSRDDLPDLLSQFKDRKELWDCLRRVVK